MYFDVYYRPQVEHKYVFVEASEMIIRKHSNTTHALQYLAKKCKNNINIEKYQNALADMRILLAKKMCLVLKKCTHKSHFGFLASRVVTPSRELVLPMCCKEDITDSRYCIIVCIYIFTTFTFIYYFHKQINNRK